MINIHCGKRKYDIRVGVDWMDVMSSSLLLFGVHGEGIRGSHDRSCGIAASMKSPPERNTVLMVNQKQRQKKNKKQQLW